MNINSNNNEYINVGDYYKSKRTLDIYKIKQIFSINKTEIYFRLANIESDETKIITQQSLTLAYVEVEEFGRVKK